MPKEEKTEKVTIEPLKDGPLEVKNLDNFHNSRHEKIATKASMHLCRCGASKKKPFCDGTHTTTGFSGEKDSRRQPDRLDTYEGTEITILDNRGICSHAGYCTDSLPKVWQMGVEPWINPDAASTEEIIKTIKKCPSGALSYSMNSRLHNSWHSDADIYITKNGPYKVKGEINLKNTELFEGMSSDHYALCRCGQSRNKPFCDGSHWYSGFRDDEALTISEANRNLGVIKEHWSRAGSLDKLEENKPVTVSVNNKQIALIRKGKRCYAVNARCPHQGGPLQEGTVTEKGIRCPWHGYEFDLKTGKGIGNEDAVDTYETSVDNNEIQLKLPEAQNKTWTVSHVMVETLVNWGLDTVFGMVGHSNLGLAEAIRVQEKRGKLRYIGIRHEGAASFAASGYAKASGRIAACLSIAGPGATNLLTGLWDARVDRVPILALTGQVQTQVMGPHAFQEINLKSAFEAVAGFSQAVLPGSNHAELASLAMKKALVNEEVSHLIFPDDVQTLEAGIVAPKVKEGRMAPTGISPEQISVDYSVYRILRAERPVIIAGFGAGNAMPEVMALAERLNCPVLTTFKAKGFISDYHPLAGGVLGRSGTPVASHFMNRSDLLIVFGSSFSNHTGIDANKAIIQVDRDRNNLGKFHYVDEPVWGDIGVTAQKILKALPEHPENTSQRDEIAEVRNNWQQEKNRRAAEDRGRGINSAVIFKELSEVIPADALISVDVGNNTYSFGRYFECREQRVIMSGYLGSIGFAFPAAMGAWAAVKNDRRVVSISGDAGFGQYMAEFTTAVKNGMNIVHILLNNNELGKISKEQRDGEWQVWQTELKNPDFAEYARIAGGVGIRVTRASQLKEAFTKAFERKNKPVLIEIISDPLLT